MEGQGGVQKECDIFKKEGDKQEEESIDDEYSDDKYSDDEYYEKPNPQEMFQYLEKIGLFGFETENRKEQSLINQSNAILTIISIFSLVILYLISFEIFIFNSCQKMWFLSIIFLLLSASLSFAIKVQIMGKS